MARNQEKAMLLLNRYWAAKKEEGKPKKRRRPFLASECTNVRQAERWRIQGVCEISQKVSQIQNPGLGEFRIRDLNDEINKLLREKKHWEERIRELGGPDYEKTGPRMLDHEGKEVPGNRGYKYFGAARDLPGVRELFDKPPAKASRKTRGELSRNVDADYYGYRDEDDGVIVPLEQEVEKKAIAAAVKHWEELHAQGKVVSVREDEDIYTSAKGLDMGSGSEAEEEGDGGEEKAESLTNHLEVPSQKEIEEMLVRRKKMELLEKYATEALVHQEEEAKALLGYTS
ncbi:hypothetical protein EMCRGX_G000302 [Ephydatia muelleri]